MTKMSNMKELKRETVKWLNKIERETKGITLGEKLDKKQTEEILKNMRAYISDCRYFMAKGDWVRAFEAVTYAWGIFETMMRAGLIRKA